MSYEGLKIVSTIQLPKNEDLYKLVDFLNKNLKEKNIIIGLSMSENNMNITLYEV